MKTSSLIAIGVIGVIGGYFAYEYLFNNSNSPLSSGSGLSALMPSGSSQFGVGGSQGGIGAVPSDIYDTANSSNSNLTTQQMANSNFQKLGYGITTPSKLSSKDVPIGYKNTGSLTSFKASNVSVSKSTKNVSIPVTKKVTTTIPNTYVVNNQSQMKTLSNYLASKNSGKFFSFSTLSTNGFKPTPTSGVATSSSVSLFNNPNINPFAVGGFLHKYAGNNSNIIPAVKTSKVTTLTNASLSYYQGKLSNGSKFNIFNTSPLISNNGYVLSSNSSTLYPANISKNGTILSSTIPLNISKSLNVSNTANNSQLYLFQNASLFQNPAVYNQTLLADYINSSQGGKK